MNIIYAETNEVFPFVVTVNIGTNGKSVATITNEDGETFTSGVHDKTPAALAEVFQLAHI